MTILLSIMEVSNCIAIVGKQVGFQTISLPILITLLLVILVGYIDSFMLKQRAKEFANYLLLGMEKSKLSFMFLCEFLIIGIACFIAGVLIGFGIYAALCIFSIPLVNLKLNLLLPIVMHNILLRAAFCFAVCFLVFYVCYFFVVYTISKQYVSFL